MGNTRESRDNVYVLIFVVDKKNVEMKETANIAKLANINYIVENVQRAYIEKCKIVRENSTDIINYKESSDIERFLLIFEDI